MLALEQLSGPPSLEQLVLVAAPAGLALVRGRVERATAEQPAALGQAQQQEPGREQAQVPVLGLEEVLASPGA